MTHEKKVYWFRFQSRVRSMTERMEHTRHRPVVATAKHFEVTIGVPEAPSKIGQP